MLPHVKTLSLWEIAHYWHGFDPRESTTHHLPLKVRDTMLVLSMWCGKKIAYRVDREKAHLMEVLKQAPRFTARHYRNSFRNAIDKKVFGRQFFSKIIISRSQLARLCISNNEPLPIFWFPDGDESNIDVNDESVEITAGGRYQLILIYDDTDKPTGESVREQPIATTVSSNAIKAAHAKHAPRNDIKKRFIAFYQQESSNFSSKQAAAESFFDSLDEKKEKLLFNNKETATRTLLAALRSQRKKPE